jgi:hypothetical protein
VGTIVGPIIPPLATIETSLAAALSTMIGTLGSAVTGQGF